MAHTEDTAKPCAGVDEAGDQPVHRPAPLPTQKSFFANVLAGISGSSWLTRGGSERTGGGIMQYGTAERSGAPRQLCDCYTAISLGILSTSRCLPVPFPDFESVRFPGRDHSRTSIAPSAPSRVRLAGQASETPGQISESHRSGGWQSGDVYTLCYSSSGYQQGQVSTFDNADIHRRASVTGTDAITRHGDVSHCAAHV